MLANHYQSGKKKVGSIKMILGDGSNGTVDTIWVEDTLMIKGKSKDGTLSKDTSIKSNTTVVPKNLHVAAYKDKPYFIGLMIVERYN